MERRAPDHPRWVWGRDLDSPTARNRCASWCGQQALECGEQLAECRGWQRIDPCLQPCATLECADWRGRKKEWFRGEIGGSGKIKEIPEGGDHALPWPLRTAPPLRQRADVHV